MLLKRGVDNAAELRCLLPHMLEDGVNVGLGEFPLLRAERGIHEERPALDQGKEGGGGDLYGLAPFPGFGFGIYPRLQQNHRLRRQP